MCLLTFLYYTYKQRIILDFVCNRNNLNWFNMFGIFVNSFSVEYKVNIIINRHQHKLTRICTVYMYIHVVQAS